MFTLTFTLSTERSPEQSVRVLSVQEGYGRSTGFPFTMTTVPKVAGTPGWNLGTVTNIRSPETQCNQIVTRIHKLSYVLSTFIY